MTSVQAELYSTRLNDELNILSSALDAQQRGWSIIPLLGGGNSTGGKRPRVAWKKYQQQQATERQIEIWFAEECTAYGVVCGEISKLIVIDFDEEQAQAEFIRRYPQLMNTRIVQSGLRRTLHIYLQVDFPVKTCKLHGGDLKAEGSYVVGAGSQIAGRMWQVVKDAPLYQVSESGLNEFLLEFGIQQTISIGLSQPAADAKSPDDFLRIYQYLVNEVDSRNEALFRTGCTMRDEGYSLADVIAVLASIHANQQPTHQHKAERYNQRHAEAERSIRSVFSKPPRPKKQRTTKRATASYVPNALREAILKAADGAAFLRVYEGLLLNGKLARDTITEREALAVLSPYGVGRPSVRKALKFSITPALRNPPHADADLALPASATKKCVFVQTTAGDKTQGRPPRRYLIPDIMMLCQRLNIDNRGADPITVEDIQSPAIYRAALNREVIKRRPGKYSQTWLGNRLSVSSRTIQRYLKRENIQSRQLLEETRIDWGNVNQIPTAYTAKRAGFDIQPYFLQDERGKRYPPKSEIAKKLLKQHHGVWLIKRGLKMYWYEREPLPKIQVEQSVESPTKEGLFLKPDYPVDAVIIPTQTMPIQSDVLVNDSVLLPQHIVKAASQKRPKTQPKRSTRYYKKPLPDDTDEWLAQKVYQATGNLQEIEARQLVDKYGRKAVGQALGRMEYLREKGDLRNPAGFMKVASRVSWRSINGFALNSPQYKSPPKRKRRKTAYDSKNDPIWQSEAYRTWRLSFVDAPIDIWEMPQLEQEVTF
ncbi:MAG: bifunctional DNA primase/polymerase [Anaerolineae bacterium]|nr:bifunctional DNA primase/polymerase [Anaerolineae bacterium]